MKVSFLTTVRCIDEFRLINLQKVVDDISSNFPGWEIIVVEQDKEQTLESHFTKTAVKYFHVYNPGLFNKSWGMNVAFTKSSGDILVVCDADMLVPKKDLERAVMACEKELCAVRPYCKFIDMTSAETDAFMLTNELPKVLGVNQGFNREHVSETPCFAGGVFVVRRDYYARVGGMDERFSGWGGEDDAMSIKLLGMSSKVVTAKNAIACHLWHPRGDRYSHGSYNENRQLLQQYKSMSKTRLSELCLEQYKSFADEKKYYGRMHENS